MIGTIAEYDCLHWVISLVFSCAKFYLLPPATKLGQGYIFIGVCDSVHGGGGLPQSMLGDTVNTREVRILLECNLVLKKYLSIYSTKDI